MQQSTTKLFALALLYGFFSRVIGDTFQTNLFQSFLLLLPIGIMVSVAFNLFYSLRPRVSGILVAGWFTIAFLGYSLEGFIHNLLQPDAPYFLFGLNFLKLFVASVFGFVIGTVVPLIVLLTNRTRTKIKF